LATPKGKVIAELGAGDGRVVELLLKKGAKQVIAIEKDPLLAELLREKFKEKVLVVEDDVLNVELNCDGVVGNIPYYISRPILKHLATQSFQYGVLILQKEMVDKLLAPPGKENYRAISVVMQAAFSMKKICKVGKGCFSPIPAVDSTMILIKRKKSLSTNIITFIENLFKTRNKRLKILNGKRPRHVSAEEIIKIAEGIGDESGD
jgi:16S rRNA (adenine1518-N6/adenine1519-N6)-dimethyltransferase